MGVSSSSSSPSKPPLALMDVGSSPLRISDGGEDGLEGEDEHEDRRPGLAAIC